MKPALITTCIVLLIVAANSHSAVQADDELAFARRNPDQQRKWTQRNIEQASSEQIERLVLGADAWIACRASWERLMRRRNKEQAFSETDRARFGNEFVKVVGQRFQTDPPQWWTDAIGLHLRVGKPLRDSETTLLAKVESKSASSRPARLSGWGDVHVIHSAGQGFEIAEQLLKPFSAPIVLACILPGDNASFVAVHGDRAIEYPLVCISAHSTTVKWSARVWAGGGKFEYAGKGYHIAQLLENKESVVVFGAGDDCVYAESFDIDTGKPLVKFSSGD